MPPKDCAAVASGEHTVSSIDGDSAETAFDTGRISAPTPSVMAKCHTAGADGEHLILAAVDRQKIGSRPGRGHGPAPTVEMADGAGKADNENVVERIAPDVEQEALGAGVELVPALAVPAEDHTEITDRQEMLGVHAPETVERRARAAGKVVGGNRAVARWLIQMAVRVHPARRDPAAGGIDAARRRAA